MVSANLTDGSGDYSGNGELYKQGAGLMVLSGSNTYEGGTAINGGTLSVATIADSGYSNLSIIGTAGAGAGYLGLANGCLQYTGSGAASTTRDLWINTSGSSGTFNIARSLPASSPLRPKGAP